MSLLIHAPGIFVHFWHHYLSRSMISNRLGKLVHYMCVLPDVHDCDGIAGLILGLHPANERWHYFVTTSLIGWAQAQNQLCIGYVDGLVQERCNSNALAMEIRLSCSKPSYYLCWTIWEWVCCVKFGSITGCLVRYEEHQDPSYLQNTSSMGHCLWKDSLDLSAEITLTADCIYWYSVSPIYRGWWGPSNGTTI